MKRALSNQRGYMILEVLIAASVAAGIAYYIATSIADTLNNSNTANSQLLANQMVQERISKLKSLSGYYVPVTSASGQPGLYVGCYSRQSVALEGTGSEKIVFGQAPGKPSGACKTDIEIQFYPSPSDNSQLTSYVIIYRKADHKDFSLHQRTIRLEKTIPMDAS